MNQQSLLRMILTLVQKELRVELRSKEVLYGMVLFSAVIVLLFSFAFWGTSPPSPEVKAALLWVTMAFTSVLTLHQSFVREREANTFSSLLLSPISRVSIYLSKWISMVILTLPSTLVVLFLMMLFLRFQVASIKFLCLLLSLGAAGLLGIGCLFAAPLGKTGRSSMLLPLLVYPLSIPIFIAGIRGTCSILCDGSASAIECQTVLDQATLLDLIRWIKLLLTFDLLVILSAVWLFEPLCQTD